MYEKIETTNFLDTIPMGQISSSFLLGLSVGYFFKKSFKILLFVAGLVTVAIFWFNSQNIVEVNGNNILNFFDVLSETLKSSYDFVYNYLTKLEPIGGASIIAGFFTGLKIG